MKIIPLNFLGINDKTPSETKWQSISIAWHWRAPNDQCCRHWFRTILHARKQHQSSIDWAQGSTTRSPTQNWWQRKIQIFGRFAHGKRTSHGSSQSVSLCSQNMNFHAKILLCSNGEPDEESKKALIASCRKMLSRTKKMFARDHKTLEITPTKVSSHKSRSSLPGGQKQTLQLISQ